MSSYITQQIMRRVDNVTRDSTEPSSENAVVGDSTIHEHADRAGLSGNSLRVKIVTLNINGQNLSGAIDKMLSIGKECQSAKCYAGCPCPDFVVFCFQESMKLSIKRVTKDLFSGRQREKHCNRLRESLKEHIPPNYIECLAEEMVGLFTIVFCRDVISQYVLYSQSAIVARGIAGLGNKGAVGIRIKISMPSHSADNMSTHHSKSIQQDGETDAQDNLSTTIVFVNAHLAASEEEVERRNQDMSVIGSDLQFPASPQEEHSFSFHERSLRRGLVAGHLGHQMLDEDSHHLRKQDPEDISHESNTERLDIFDSDYLFVAGDLNYRIALEHDEVLKLVEEQDFAKLMQADQLSTERALGRILQDFDEAPINFRPTYKFDKIESHDRQYDTSGKHRTPSYTDRILYHVRPNLPDVLVEAYTSHEDVLCSDHLPVSLTVKLQC